MNERFRILSPSRVRCLRSRSPACCPWFRLPDQAVANLAGMMTFDPIHYASSQPLPGWHLGLPGLILAIAIFSIWILALLPKICTLRYGIFKGLKFMVASVSGPKRKTISSFRTTPRGPFSITYLLVGFGLLVASPFCWPGNHYRRLIG